METNSEANVRSTRSGRNEECDVCHSNSSKYTCPRCQLKTCCLSCVKSHKSESGCSGVRDKTAYVPIKEFSENNLLSDYRFLEDADRKRYGAHGDQLSKPGYLNFRWKMVSKECYKRGVKLKLLPHHFSKHKENSTSYNKKLKLMMWHIKWIFMQAQAEFIDIRLRESISLREALGRYLDPKTADPIIRHKLKMYKSNENPDIMIFMKVENLPANSVRYHQLALDQTLRDNLAGRGVLEYPTLHVVLRQHSDHFTLNNKDKRKPSDAELEEGEVESDEEAEKEEISPKKEMDVASAEPQEVG